MEMMQASIICNNIVSTVFFWGEGEGWREGLLNINRDIIVH